MRDFMIVAGSVGGIYACYLLWRFAKIIDRIERDVDNIRISKGLPPRNVRYYVQDDDLRDQELLKRVELPPHRHPTEAEMHAAQAQYEKTMKRLEDWTKSMEARGQESMKRT